MFVRLPSTSLCTFAGDKFAGAVLVSLLGLHMLTDGTGCGNPDLPGIPRLGKVFQRAPQVPQAVGLTNDVGV